MKSFFIALLLFASFLFFGSAYGQHISTDKEGQKFVLYEDGTWSKLGEAKPKFPYVKPPIDNVISSEIIGDEVLVKILKCGEEYSLKEKIVIGEKVTESFEFTFRTSNMYNRYVNERISFSQTTIKIGTHVFQYIMMPPYSGDLKWYRNLSGRTYNMYESLEVGGGIIYLNGKGLGYDNKGGKFSLEEAVSHCVKRYESILRSNM